jgi:quercetin dioxygenase-like cupin family protein
MIHAMKLSYSIAALVLLISPALAQQGGKVVVTPITTTTQTASGQPIKPPADGAKVIVSMYEIAPGAKLPPHKHPRVRYGYMEAGLLRVSNLVTGKIDEYRAGEFIVDAVDQWHEAENPGKEPVKLLVIDQVEAGSNDGNTVMR